MSAEITDMLDRCNDVIGGVCGNHISWFNWGDKPLEAGETYRAYGHKPYNQRPKVGDTVAAEMERSWVLFEVKTIKHENNPPDMFWLDLEPIEQIIKPAPPATVLRGGAGND